MESFVQDIRFAWRTLFRARAFTGVAVATLALGIGATTTVFSIVDAVLLKPLPYSHPEQLVKVWGAIRQQNISQNWISEPEYWDLTDRLSGLATLGAFFTGSGANLTRQGGEPVRATVMQASATVLALLNVSTRVGRVFTADEDRPGRDHVALLDYGFWQEQFGGDPSVVGKTIELNGEAYTIVGVLPNGFNFGGDANVWLPLALDRANPGGRGNHYLEVVGRLSPAASLPQLDAALQEAAQRMAAQFPQFYVKNSGFGLYARDLHADIVGDAPRPILAVFAAVGCVLLIACVNIANLLLVRGSSRQREFTVRGALGASGARLARLVFCEALILATLGGIAGVLLAIWVTDIVSSSAAAALPRAHAIGLDGRVLLFALGASVATVVVFAALPALRASRQPAFPALKDAARGSSSGGHGLRSGLVIVEIAFAVVLLGASGLLVKSLVRLLDVNPGFNPRGVLTARVSVPATEYRDITAANAFYAALDQRVRTLPAVTAVGATSLLPMTGRNSSGSTFIDRTTAQGLAFLPLFQKTYFEADRRTVTPGYFEAMGISLRRGRLLTAADTSDGPAVAVVDDAFARKAWPDRDPIGERIAVNTIPNVTPPKLQWRTVVGVVAHVHHSGLDQLGREQTYVPLAQTTFPIRNMYLAVRTSGDPSTLANVLQAQVRAIDPSLPIYDVKPMESWIESTATPRRFTMTLFVTFGVLALLLAGIGTYGVMAYAVGQRTQEIGIRLALGATRYAVVRLVVGQSLRLGALGVGLGLGFALAAASSMSSLLYGVEPHDPATLASVCAILFGVSVAAALVPAQRATRVSPMQTMRSD